jgi:hypothetical protein
MVGWINLIQHKDTLNQLICNAFSRLAFLNRCYIEHLNNNLPSRSIKAMTLQNAVTGKESYY